MAALAAGADVVDAANVASGAGSGAQVGAVAWGTSRRVAFFCESFFLVFVVLCPTRFVSRVSPADLLFSSTFCWAYCAKLVSGGGAVVRYGGCFGCKNEAKPLP